ncbi:MAG: hypothetical protein EU540_04045 [Promethearchaeota archaeon]|nr:MAG: hypothetical protein EU540_04045 [Candidatus Lokiarchaeota archaeon]
MYYDISAFCLFFVFGIITIFLLIQLRKADKIAKPFLLTMSIFFLCILIGQILIYIFNIATKFGTTITVGTPNPMQTIRITGYFLTIGGALPLIYVLERSMFQKSLIKEKHIVTIIQFLMVISLIIFDLLFLFFQFTDTPILLNIAFIMGLIVTQALFFGGGFFLIGLRSSGEYRRNSLFVAFGYILRVLLNVFSFLYIYRLGASPTQSNLTALTIFMTVINVLNIIAILIMAFGLLKIYKKSE